MDPNVTLRRIRQLIDHVLTDSCADDTYPQEAVELAEKMAALDNWLAHRAALPKDWER
jgi:hypothetical protein